MELKWLEDFACLANTASFSRAAEERCITQSAFSRRIKQLELWLGVTLVSRATFPVELTREGKAFLNTAQDAIRNFYATREALRPVGEQQEQTLTFSALHTLAVVFFPTWLQEVTQRFGDFRSRLIPDRGGIEDNIGTLVEGEADFLLTYAHASVPFLVDATRFPALVLGTERVIPVAAPHAGGTMHERMAREGMVQEGMPLLDQALQSGTPLPYLSYGAFSFFGVALSKLFAGRASFQRRIVHENTISIGLKSMALAGWGVAWLPERLIRDELASGKLVPASADPAWNLDVEIRLYRHAASARPIVNAFWSTIAAAVPASSAGK